MIIPHKSRNRRHTNRGHHLNRKRGGPSRSLRLTYTVRPDHLRRLTQRLIRNLTRRRSIRNTHNGQRSRQNMNVSRIPLNGRRRRQRRRRLDQRRRNSRNTSRRRILTLRIMLKRHVNDQRRNRYLRGRSTHHRSTKISRMLPGKGKHPNTLMILPLKINERRQKQRLRNLTGHLRKTYNRPRRQRRRRRSRGNIRRPTPSTTRPHPRTTISLNTNLPIE